MQQKIKKLNLITYTNFTTIKTLFWKKKLQDRNTEQNLENKKELILYKKKKEKIQINAEHQTIKCSVFKVLFSS